MTSSDVDKYAETIASIVKTDEKLVKEALYAASKTLNFKTTY